MSVVERLPDGFLAGGRNVGIKNSKRDMGILISDSPAVFAACVSSNLSRAPSVSRTLQLDQRTKTVRAVVAVSGNANGLTGEKGAEDDREIARTVARHLSVGEDEVLTASTGVLGHRLPMSRILEGAGPVLSNLSRNPTAFAESIMTTDYVVKMRTREFFVAGQRIRLHAVAKGSGMVAPALATTLCFITTDAVISKPALHLALASAVDATLNQLTVDGDMSTNDQVIVLANGFAENKAIAEAGQEYEVFRDNLEGLLAEVARAIADDGEGATRLIEVEVNGASSVRDARIIARAIPGSLLVKAAVFGADPYAWGRIVATAGAAAARNGVRFDLDRLAVDLQGIRVFERGIAAETARAPQLRHKMTEPEINVALDLGQGSSTAKAWGCDLSYDYVKMNADYAAATTTQVDGSVAVNERLAELGPTIKKKLLIEALRYIDRFRGIRAVIKLGGAAMIDAKLEEQFAEDVLLLRSVGLLPIVVHGGGPEISRTLEKLGVTSEFVNGLRVTDETSMNVVEMVLTGSVNQRLVAALNKNGSRAIGLSGKDGGLLRAKKLVTERDLGRVGEVVSVNVTLIDMLEKDGYIPVISPVGLGEEGTAYNINADTVASELARGVGAEKLIFLSDVPGLLDGDQVVSELDSDQLKARLDRDGISGGMRPKLEASLAALADGVRSVHLVDGRVPHNLIAELFTDHGVGTLIRRA
jgi:acetylglutamate kinase